MEHFGIVVSEIQPTFHPAHESVKDFVESFLFFFQRGANAEQRMLKPELFKEIVMLAKREASLNEYAGGNALTIAQRVALEGGGRVVLGAQISRQAKSQLHPSLEFVTPDTSDEIDVHLALEYHAGDFVQGLENITAPRTNRYYMNADVHNSRLTAAKVLHDHIASLPDSADFVQSVTGLQIADRDRLDGDVGQQLDVIADAIRKHRGASHFESGAFEDFDLFEAAWTRGILHAVSSIGLNEQELALLDWKLHSTETEPPRGSDAQPALDETVDVLKQVLRTLGHEGSLSRMHFHTLHFHAVCYDPAIWSHGQAAVGIGSAVTSDLSCGDAFENRNTAAFDLRYPRYVSCNASKALPGEVGPETVECCVAPVLVCKKPKRTAGLGDSISGAGLRYHKLHAEGKRLLLDRSMQQTYCPTGVCKK